VDSSYPRRFLSEYAERHPKENAVVLDTQWKLSNTEVLGLKELLGGGVTGDTVRVSRRYKETTSHWVVPVNEADATAHVIASSALHAEEQTALADVKTIEALKKRLEGLGAAATERHTALSAHLANHFNPAAPWPPLSISLHTPKFFYSKACWQRKPRAP
jgi:hypothetical protein